MMMISDSTIDSLRHWSRNIFRDHVSAVGFVQHFRHRRQIRVQRSREHASRLIEQCLFQLSWLWLISK